MSLKKATAAVCVLTGLGLALTALADEPAARRPYTVTVQDDKPTVVEPTLPVEPQEHAQLNGQGNMAFILHVDGKMMHLGAIQTVLKLDGHVALGNFGAQGNGGRFLEQNQPLPRKPGKARRTGFRTVYERDKVQITQTVEVVPTKAAKGSTKRRLDAVLVRYQVENKDQRPHSVGVRVWMDMYLVNNDGALFAAPTKPNQILDGVELKGKDVPDYLQVLQVPNLKNPGYVAHFTYQLGKGYERPERVVLTALRGAFGNNGWDMVLFPAMGDSAMGFYWEPKDVKPGQKRNLAYAYGEGIATNPEGEGVVAVALGGSFEPGKLFTVSAYVQDPAPGQYLALELPEGVERVEGKERQPVPDLDENGNAMVLWKARVRRPGRFPLRVRSSTGVTQTKVVTVRRAGEKGEAR